jgi:hypothetical protein
LLLNIVAIEDNRDISIPEKDICGILRSFFQGPTRMKMKV